VSRIVRFTEVPIPVKVNVSISFPSVLKSFFAVIFTFDELLAMVKLLVEAKTLLDAE
jgi:hypothetical protein